jgi:hypothetical protein
LLPKNTIKKILKMFFIIYYGEEKIWKVLKSIKNG